jgi:hypothetical protein
MTIRHVKWTLFGPVLALWLLSQGFGAYWNPIKAQPAQMSSQVNYDPKLTDPFLQSNEWSYRDGGKIPNDEKDPLLKHTAKCFSNSFGSEHEVRFCKAWLLDTHTIELVIYEGNPAYDDNLRIRINDGMFTCQYWAEYRVIRSYDGHFTQGDQVWTTTTQKLTLDKKTYRRGDVIKGKIEFECLEEATHPKWIEDHGKNPNAITLNGVFKTILK